jgi:scyllo-inositol 2-dehydrogenase (NADP+)
MKKIRIAVAGLGAAFRQIHEPAYRKIRQLEIVAAADPARPNVKYRFPVFESVEEMLAQVETDILAVLAPPDQHYAIARAGLLAGCHVLCEKPFMVSLEEADGIIDLAKTCDRWVVVNNQYRFMNIHRAAKQQIGRAGFGNLLFLSAQQTFYVTPSTEIGWRGEQKRRTCIEFGTHVLDLCRYFFGEDPNSVLARMPKGANQEGPDYLNLIQLEFSDDRVAHITLDRLSRGPHKYLSIRLDGSQGCIETHLGGGIEFRAGVRGLSRRPFLNLNVSPGGYARLYHGERYRTLATDPLDVFANATKNLLEEFLAALEKGVRPPNDAADNRQTLALMLAAYESHETNSRVKIDDLACRLSQ